MDLTRKSESSARCDEDDGFDEGFLSELGDTEVLGPTDIIHVKALEDVEAILEGAMYLECPRCEENKKNNRRLLNADCPDCRAWGVLPNPRYVEAAERLGLPVPQSAADMAMKRIDHFMASRG